MAGNTTKQLHEALGASAPIISPEIKAVQNQVLSLKHSQPGVKNIFASVAGVDLNIAVEIKDHQIERIHSEQSLGTIKRFPKLEQFFKETVGANYRDKSREKMERAIQLGDKAAFFAGHNPFTPGLDSVVSVDQGATTKPRSR